MREIVLDTETTGLDPAGGHRIVEIGCVELLNHLPTGRAFQCYVNPERSMPTDAFGVHGLSAAFLAHQPRFSEIVESLLEFFADSPLVIHNAAFDLAFLNAELRRLVRDEIPSDRTIDTVQMARRKYPGAPASLDALCRRYQIDLADRMLHGALKDAQLLARVYLELRGGRQPGLSLVSAATKRLPGIEPEQWVAKIVYPTADEEAAHREFVDAIPNALWRNHASLALESANEVATVN
jgi:DNA polymerase III subunit epsilon